MLSTAHGEAGGQLQRLRLEMRAERPAKDVPELRGDLAEPRSDGDAEIDGRAEESPGGTGDAADRQGCARGVPAAHRPAEAVAGGDRPGARDGESRRGGQGGGLY